MEDSNKTLETVAVDWIASVVTSQSGWALKKEQYKKGVTPTVDALFSWLDRIFTSSGELPSYETMVQRWGRMPWPKKVLPESFAVLELEQAYKRWELIEFKHDLDNVLANGTTNEAWKLTREFSARSMTGSTPFGIELDDPMLYMDDVSDQVLLPSWGPVMDDKALRRGDFALLSARTSIGKSWLLLMAACDALQQGWDVPFYSLEMDAAQLAKRLRQYLKCNVPEWLKSQPGRLHVIDQGMQKHGYAAGDLLKRVEQGSKMLIIVDYGELLRPDSGGRATEAHNKSAEISQALQQAAKFLHVPLLSAAQENRSSVGERGHGVETLSGSDQWGRDADLVVRLRDECGTPAVPSSTRILECTKTRHSGIRTPTFMLFDPDGRDQRRGPAGVRRHQRKGEHVIWIPLAILSAVFWRFIV